MGLLVILLVATLLSSSHAGSTFDAANRIKMLRQSSATATASDYKINCQSFRVGVEANNIRDWSTIPSHCKSYIKTYMQNKQYGLDTEAVCAEAKDFVQSFLPPDPLRDSWVFDVEETSLINIDYLSSPEVDFGTYPINSTAYYEWLLKNTTTPLTNLPAVTDLYYFLLNHGFNLVFISEAPESMRRDMNDILARAGYWFWGEIILKGDADIGKSAAQFKTEKRRDLEERGYKIVGNIGDQWSDLTGENAGIRTFKVPNPIYYIG